MIKENQNEWIQHYKQWKTSHKTQKEYCKEQGINTETFKRRLYYLRKKGWIEKPILSKPISDIPSKSGRFDALHITDMHEEKTPYCEIRFQDQHSIQISSKESLYHLKEMIQCMMQV